MKMKTMMREHCTPIRMTKIEKKKKEKTLSILSAGKNAEQLVFSYIAGEKV